MGVPELLKYVARTCPSALNRLPQRKDKIAITSSTKGSSSREQRLPQLWFDHIIVDATNIVQTIGIDALKAMLCDDEDTVAAIGVKQSLILVCDGARQRQGTARAGRAHVATQSTDLTIQKFIQAFNASEEARVADLSGNVASPTSGRKSGGAGGSAIKRGRDDDNEANKSGNSEAHLRYKAAELRFVGREHFGEGDFKILNIHRRIAFGAAVPGSSAATKGKQQQTQKAPVDPEQLPSFLFVSEDADLFCGALCGPFPQNVSIGTQLREATADMCILSVEKVLVALGQAAGIFYSSSEEEAAATGAAVTTSNNGIPAEEAKKVETSEEYLRSMLPDGAKSKKTKFEDSDDDDDDEGDAKPTAASAVAAKGNSQQQKGANPANNNTDGPLGKFVNVSEESMRMASDLHKVCRDFTFLFTMILGNDVLPGAVQGATKVDASACWQSYCTKKYSEDDYTGITKTLNLMTVNHDHLNSEGGAGGGRNSRGGEQIEDEEEARLDPKFTVSVHTQFLSGLVSALHYSDAAGRPPASEERRIARAYLRKLAQVIFNYTTGPLIDTREEQGEKKLQPSVASLLQVLSSRAERPAEFKPICDSGSNATQLASGASVGMGYGQPATSSTQPIRYCGGNKKEHAPLPGAVNLGVSIAMLAKGTTDQAALDGEGKRGVPLLLSTLETAWARSLVPSIAKLKKDADSLLRSTKSTKSGGVTSTTGPQADSSAGTVKARFGFDTRRMMPVAAAPASNKAAPATAASGGGWFGASGLSTSYYSGQAPPPGTLKKQKAEQAEQQAKKQAEHKATQKAKAQEQKQKKKEAEAAGGEDPQGEGAKRKKRPDKKQRLKMKAKWEAEQKEKAAAAAPNNDE